MTADRPVTPPPEPCRGHTRSAGAAARALPGHDGSTGRRAWLDAVPPEGLAAAPATPLPPRTCDWFHGCDLPCAWGLNLCPHHLKHDTPAPTMETS